MRHRSSFLSTATATKTSQISHIGKSETTIENTYRDYEKYFNKNIVVDTEKLDCNEYSDTITFAKNMIETIKEESEGTKTTITSKATTK